MSSRRLSVAPALAAPAAAENRAPPGARPARKSFGTALPAGAAAAAAGPSVKGLALTQLYQTVLKMSTENVRREGRGRRAGAAGGRARAYGALTPPPPPPPLTSENQRKEFVAAAAH
jgi:hypothetical protein